MASFRFGGAALAIAGAMLLGACEETRPDIPRPVIADSEIAEAEASLQGEWVPPPAGWNSYAEQTGAIRRVVPRMRTASSRLCRERRFPQLGNAAQCTRMLHSWLEDVNLAYYDDNVNAWVQPSGKIVFASGLMQVAANDDEIAFVLGHEMAHGFAGHFDKQLQGTAGGALVGSCWRRASPRRFVRSALRRTTGKPPNTGPRLERPSAPCSTVPSGSWKRTNTA